MPKVVASIEARMTSSRLPGKVLMDVAGRPALTRLITRLRQCKNLDEIVLACTDRSEDDALEDWANKEGVAFYRGSEDDVLQRVVDAQRSVEGEIVVEITGDCILTDPEIVDSGITTYLENDCDVVSNCWKLAYPMGMNVQVFSLENLEKVAREITDPLVREHVSLYFYKHPEIYRLIHMFPPARWYGPEYRMQLDYPQDLEFINEIYQRLEPDYRDDFGLEEIMQLLKEHPWLPEINRTCVERSPR